MPAICGEHVVRPRVDRLEGLADPAPPHAAALKAKLLGHYNHYGVIGNATRLGAYWIAVQKFWYRQLNRRSQRRSYNWTGFYEMWQCLCMPRPA